MKPKNAKRFLLRNSHKIAREKINDWPSKSFKDQVKKCQKTLRIAIDYGYLPHLSNPVLVKLLD